MSGLKCVVKFIGYQVDWKDGAHHTTSSINSHYSDGISLNSGNPGYGTNFFYHDPLWDGHQCGSIETACCQRTGIPWYNKEFNYSTTDYIEMRICLDEGTSDEDCAVGHYEIYVK